MSSTKLWFMEMKSRCSCTGHGPLNRILLASPLSKTPWGTCSHDILFQLSFWNFSWRKYWSCFQLQGSFPYSGMGHKGQRLKKRQIANSWVFGICIIQFSVLNFWWSCIILDFTIKTDPLLEKRAKQFSHKAKEISPR